MALRSKIVGFLIVGVLAASSAFVVGRQSEPQTSQYDFAIVDRGDVTERVSLVGRVNAKKTVEIGAEVSGRIENVLVQENQNVGKGDILATIEAEQFVNEVARAKAKLLQAEAARDKQLANVERLARQLDRRQDVSSSLAYSSEEIERIRFEKRAAEADLKFTTAAVLLSQSELERAQLEHARTIIRSPVDGIVLENRISTGQTVNASLETPVLFVIASDLNEFQLEANIDEAIVTKIDVGFEVTFTAEAYEEARFKARVSRIRKIPAPDINYVAYPALFDASSGPEAPLMPGMTVNITADLIEPARSVIRVPVDATRYFHAAFKPAIPDVVKENFPRDQWEAAAFGYDQGAMLRHGYSRVFVIDKDEQVVPKLVRLGASNYDYVEITSDNLEEGERVILGLNPNYEQ